MGGVFAKKYVVHSGDASYMFIFTTQTIPCKESILSMKMMEKYSKGLNWVSVNMKSFLGTHSMTYKKYGNIATRDHP